MPDRRYLVADRNRRNHDHAAARGPPTSSPARRRYLSSAWHPQSSTKEGTSSKRRAAVGNLVLTTSWPGQIRTVYGDHQRVIDTYYRTYKGMYFTGDGARRDADGYYWITGRVDDVMNVSGHRMGTAEVESALVLHTAVAEAAVVGYPACDQRRRHLCLRHADEQRDAERCLKQELSDLVRKEIGAIAKPDVIQWAPGLPKTRSGKIMRRILRKIAANELENLGDTTTLGRSAVVDDLVKNRPNG